NAGVDRAPLGAQFSGYLPGGLAASRKLPRAVFPRAVGPTATRLGAVKLAFASNLGGQFEPAATRRAGPVLLLAGDGLRELEPHRPEQGVRHDVQGRLARGRRGDLEPGHHSDFAELAIH